MVLFLNYSRHFITVCSWHRCRSIALQTSHGNPINPRTEHKQCVPQITAALYLFNGDFGHEYVMHAHVEPIRKLECEIHDRFAGDCWSKPCREIQHVSCPRACHDKQSIIDADKRCSLLEHPPRIANRSCGKELRNSWSDARVGRQLNTKLFK